MSPAATSQVNPDWIGSRLVAAGKISEGDLEKALAFQREMGGTSNAYAVGGLTISAIRPPSGRLGAVLIRMGALSEDALLPHLAKQTGLSILPAGQLPTTTEIQEGMKQLGLNVAWCLSREAIPYLRDQLVKVAAKDPLDRELNELVAYATSASGIQSAEFSWLRSNDVAKLLSILKDTESGSRRVGNLGDANYLRELAEEAPVIEFVNNVLAQAVDERASDIHIEPGERDFEVRLRVDGVLQTRMARPRDGFDAIASRVKLISGLDIAERRLPQDGRITTRVSGVEMDIRVSAIPGVHGESLVLRLLPKERADLSLASLGMSPDILKAFQEILKQPNGIVLVTGPTGSGKSTTLYSALSAINDRSLKIVTVEDPVEYRMSGITQIQTHSDIGYTFARALRSILRHDPDVIMIGEIRDAETAEIAIQSALTGHLVLATIHTNDAPSAFTRLLEMGIEPFLLATSVRAVLAQRLVRKLDPKKSAPVATPHWLGEEFASLAKSYPDAMPAKASLMAPASGNDDAGSYRGRSGIHELLTVTPDIQDAIVARRSSMELAEIARRAPGAWKFRTLREDGLIKAAHGLTSLEEVLRVAGSQSQGAGADDAMLAEDSAR
ncbi:MAG: type II/IV secretion system protein [Rhodocyclaceae bacterium]|nr:type II/IV secretion system protein [Rhodocyclaceae bacterium]MCA3020745.1 type II/IV secretion system protein [Rhodocyclaceae bacterium]MCA3025664.1 type II/IV secretion system protein [Rhodocyclaceae bacterium]MCA3030811.1 type II/IV secretion system protein [Rhodocyclaceae bacterium]MCA3036029.1 type II/IV secretion system protein [Rhodocyclaceae bacterium]